MSPARKDNGKTGLVAPRMPRRWTFRALARGLLVMACVVLLSSTAVACGPSSADLLAVDYTPQTGVDWPVSSPEAEGIDPLSVARLYYEASRLETTFSVLVVKNGRLIAERYFNGGSSERKDRLQSVTKSFTSALVGLALQEGSLSSLEQRMMEFFPELVDYVDDPRKNDITIREMLQMRAGYPWEESTDELFEMLYSGFRPSLLVDVPLVHDPGTEFEYSNLTSHLVGVIVARATGNDLLTFADERLFAPLGVEAGTWIKDWEGYYNGHADLHLTARDMARFGLLYLDSGRWGGRQIVPEEWVRDSLRTYSEDAWDYKVGDNFTDMGYGYQWWSARAGEHRFNFAWGHGGQQIAVVDELDMVIVVTADPLFGQHGGGPWEREKENLNLVGDFISSLPAR